jgi:flagellar biosynthesis/type III secretory pathway protein FliH
MVKALRKNEVEMERYREEDTDLHREIARMGAEHQAALQRAEEAGYAKGLRDAHAQGVAEGLEEAAKVCEGMDYHPESIAYKYGKAHAAAIRALLPADKGKSNE